MTLEAMANEDMRVSFTKVSGPQDAYSGDQPIDTAKVVPTLNQFIKLDGKRAATEKVSISWTTTAPPKCPWTATGHTFASGGGVILAGAVFTKADGLAFLLEGDTGDCVGAWVPSGGGSAPCKCTAKIATAGQTAAKCD